MDYEIRRIKPDEMKEALELVRKTFLEFEAIDYTEEGIEEFRKTIENREWINNKEFYGAFFNKQIIGVIAISNLNHISLFFVDGKYHKRGIGRNLFQKVCEINECGYYTVNSSPYAKVIYEHLGFKALEEEQCINDLRFYPMKNDDIYKYRSTGGVKMKKNYWDEKYWEKHLKEDDLENIEDLWIEKYENIISNPQNKKILDLGCGIGQYTKYFREKGFEVVATDISEKALNYLSKKIPDVRVILQDMTKKFSFDSQEFDIVFANLSIHFFSKEDTIKLLKEIYRILKPNGYFIGSVNSTLAYEYIKDHVIKIEENYYDSNGRYIRLWNKEQFELFFKDFEKVVLEEVVEKRFTKQKNKWEFVYKKNN